ncbi:MAG: hypothetical protein ACE5I8_08850, partial [Thermodesulfobacteriota bacterium]
KGMLLSISSHLLPSLCLFIMFPFWEWEKSPRVSAKTLAWKILNANISILNRSSYQMREIQNYFEHLDL